MIIISCGVFIPEALLQGIKRALTHIEEIIWDGKGCWDRSSEMPQSGRRDFVEHLLAWKPDLAQAYGHERAMNE